MPPIPHVPKNFKFHIEISSDSSIWTTIYEIFNEKIVECEISTSSSFPYYRITTGYFTQGYNELKGISVWVTSQRKQRLMVLSFFSKEEWEKFQTILNDNHKQKIDAIKLGLYKYSARDNAWYANGYYDFKPRIQLVGYDTYIDKIKDNIDEFLTHTEFLKKIGEMKALNFLLKGTPGMGKTSLVRIIASMYNAPICVVNPQNISLSAGIDRVLNPPTATSAPIIVLLFEDFDRFLTDQEGEKIMNHLLNGIDGINNKSNIVRFFTGNDCEIIEGNEALINRMTCTFKFGLPTREMYEMKMKQLFTYHKTYDTDLAEKFIDKVCEQKSPMSMRPFINHILMFLFKDNFLEQMLNNI